MDKHGFAEEQPFNSVEITGGIVKLKSNECLKCKYHPGNKRSLKINDRFNGWVTYIWKWMRNNQEKWQSIDRLSVKSWVLMEAVSIMYEDLEFGQEPWPLVDAVTIVYGKRTMIKIPDLATSNKTNKKMLTACRGCEIVATMLGIMLPEKPEEI